MRVERRCKFTQLVVQNFPRVTALRINSQFSKTNADVVHFQNMSAWMDSVVVIVVFLSVGTSSCGRT